MQSGRQSACNQGGNPLAIREAIRLQSGRQSACNQRGNEVPDGSAREDVDQELDAQLTEAREAPLIALCARRR